MITSSDITTISTCIIYDVIVFVTWSQSRKLRITRDYRIPYLVRTSNKNKMHKSRPVVLDIKELNNLLKYYTRNNIFAKRFYVRLTTVKINWEYFPAHISYYNIHVCMYYIRHSERIKMYLPSTYL